MTIADFAAVTPLLDHHCHGVMLGDVTWSQFASMLTEADQSTSGAELDSPLGLMVRSVCAEVLGLPRHVSAEDYWQRRQDLGSRESARLLLDASGIGRYLVDTGYRGEELTSPAELQEIAHRPVNIITRLEHVAEDIIVDVDVSEFIEKCDTALSEAATTSVGFKSIVAYRYGLDFDPTDPSIREVTQALDRWKAAIGQGGQVRLTDPVLMRFLLWRAIRLGRPIQFHVGYGDSDIRLHRCDPSQMTDFLHLTESSGTAIALLHCYPFIREAGILCQVFPHVYMDTSLGVAHSGISGIRLVAESLELVPFTKLLYASDAFGLPEIYLVGAHVWRAGMARTLELWRADDIVSASDAERYLGDIGWGNAMRMYGLGGSGD